MELILALGNIVPAILAFTGAGTITFCNYKLFKKIKVQKQIKNNHLKLYKHTGDIEPNKRQKNPFVTLLMDKKSKDYLNALNSMNIPEQLKDIVEKFKNYVEPEDLKFCVHNLQSVSINHKNILIDIKDYIQNFARSVVAAGNYSYDNQINLFFTKNGVLSHEFLHMASHDNDCIGFQSNVHNEEIGRGLNEGYTELLNQRIFTGKKRSTYQKNVKMAGLFELFFDNPKDMQHAYFKANLDTVFDEFRKHGTKEEFFEIMQDLDNFARAYIPIKDDIKYIKMQLKLYDIIKRSNNKEKIRKFEEELDKNKVISLLRKKQNLKLHYNTLETQIGFNK